MPHPMANLKCSLLLVWGLLALLPSPSYSNPFLLDKFPAGPEMPEGMTVVPSDPDEIRFLLYSDPEDRKKFEELVHKKKKTIESSKFKKDKKTVFIVHGFWSDLTTEVPKLVKDAYLESSLGHNYIVVDWSILSRSKESGYKLVSAWRENTYPMVYPIVVKKSIPIVAQRVADFIQFLIEKEFATLDNIHIVGHSLGAHTSGMAGHLIQEHKANDKKKVKRITALDPAGPLFDGAKGSPKDQRHLDSKDAEFLDVYHSAEGSRGYTGDLGVVDFYVNGGAKQPQCPKESSSDPFGAGHCSHMYIANIYAASIKKELKACKCKHEIEGKELQDCLKECPNEIPAGEKCPDTATGQYYLEYKDE